MSCLCPTVLLLSTHKRTQAAEVLFAKVYCYERAHSIPSEVINLNGGHSIHCSLRAGLDTSCEERQSIGDQYH